MMTDMTTTPTSAVTKPVIATFSAPMMLKPLRMLPISTAIALTPANGNT